MGGIAGERFLGEINFQNMEDTATEAVPCDEVDSDEDDGSLGIWSDERADREFKEATKGTQDAEAGLAKQRKKEINEIGRRQAVFDAFHETKGGTRAEPDEERAAAEVPFVIDGQEFVLFNPTHTQVRPFSMEAGFRLCGAFGDRDVADLRGAEIGSDKRLGVLRGARFMWNLACKTEDRLRNPTYQTEKILRIVGEYQKALQESKKDFDENYDRRNLTSDEVVAKTMKEYATNRTERRRRERRLRKERVREEAVREVWDRRVAELRGQQRSRQRKVQVDSIPFPRKYEVRLQKFAAVIVLDDTTESCVHDKEPVWMFLGAFDTESECNTWIDTAGKDNVPDYHIDCVAMYEWLFPSSANKERDKIPERYREKELDRVMRRRKTEKNRVKSFEQWCDKKGMATPRTEVSYDGRVSARDMRGEAVDPDLATKSSDVAVRDEDPNSAEFGFHNRREGAATGGPKPVGKTPLIRDADTLIPLPPK